MKIERRYFLQSAAALGLTQVRAASPRRKILIVLVDGCGPDYLEQSDVPNLRRMMREGFYTVGAGVIPSVTNINNASLLTASLPEEHGITTNYYYDRAAGKFSYMETADFLLRPTIFERAGKLGMRSALVAAKDKVRTLGGRGADVAISAEAPPPEFVARIGPREEIYSAAVNYWAFRAARYLLGQSDLLYLTTTDYMMHTFPPEDERSREHLHQLDALLDAMLNDHPKLEVYLTADHGMNAKSEAFDLGRLLAARNIACEAVPVVKDRYVAHHQNLGGACYIYLQNAANQERAMDLLRECPAVEGMYTAPRAAAEFHLHRDRIGDIVLLGRRHAAFGPLDHVREETRVRSHGSRHESRVPILCYGRKVDGARYRMNVDLTRNLDWGA